MLILIFLESINAIMHIAVLLNIKFIINFKNLPKFNKKYYFMYETITSLLSFMCVYNISNYMHIIMIIIHLYIHSYAIGYKLKLYKSNFYKNVFKMANYNFDEIDKSHRIGYILGTLQDIITHCLNAYYLIKKYAL